MSTDCLTDSHLGVVTTIVLDSAGPRRLSLAMAFGDISHSCPFPSLRFRQRQILQDLNRVRRSISVAEDDFQRLVALVALVFCCCNLVGAVIMAFIVKAENQMDKNQIVEDLFIWGVLSGLLNSSLNLFIYVFASTNFRAACLHLWRRKVPNASFDVRFSYSS